MFRSKRRISRWWLVLAIFLGLLIGGLLGDFIGNWLPLARLGLEIGNVEPFILTSALLDLSLQFMIRFNLGSLIGLLISILIFRLLDK
ncbi:MAG: hypothetical protein LLG09_08255 [Negativicutes bacterium]|nr:hypothetical protein [Negativicutes bacterium]